MVKRKSSRSTGFRESSYPVKTLRGASLQRTYHPGMNCTELRRSLRHREGIRSSDRARLYLFEQRCRGQFGARESTNERLVSRLRCQLILKRFLYFHQMTTIQVTLLFGSCQVNGNPPAWAREPAADPHSQKRLVQRIQPPDRVEVNLKFGRTQVKFRSQRFHVSSEPTLSHASSARKIAEDFDCVSRYAIRCG
jgi:hypothetical protein